MFVPVPYLLPYEEAERSPSQHSLCEFYQSEIEREKEKDMEDAKGAVKHVLLAKFKDDVKPERVEELIKGYASLVSLVEPMKAFHWYTISLSGCLQDAIFLA